MKYMQSIDFSSLSKKAPIALEKYLIYVLILIKKKMYI